MKVTFRANSRTGRYSPGKIYTEDLTPILEALIKKNRHLSLIDPPDIDIARAQEAAALAPKPEPTPEVKDGGDKSATPAKEPRPIVGQDSEDRANPKSGERSGGSEVESPKVGRE